MFKRIPVTDLQIYSRCIALDLNNDTAIILRNLPKVKEKKEINIDPVKRSEVEVASLIKNAMVELELLNPSDLTYEVKVEDFSKPKVADSFIGNFFPSIETETDRVLATGPSGAGKTTFCAEMIIHYLSLFPDRKVFIISSLEEDVTLEPLQEYFEENIIRFNLPEMFLDENSEIDPDTLASSMVFFDDVDTLINPHLRTKVLTFRDFLLEQHRHFNIFLLMTTHLMSNFRETRRLLNETRKIVVFPGSGADYHILNFLTKFVGIGMRRAKEIVNKTDNHTRWVMISKTAPLYMITENKLNAI